MFITCSFKSDGSGRAYTYRHELEEPVAPGDRVTVLGPDGVEKIVTVVEVDVDEPAFACKATTGIYQPETSEEQET
ncbi:hypothetical protein [Pseudooceanicola atlanticus]|uniref:Uncharacterized protein n=1 Tax=Pseudooceanicola atlanticus TaxID=1461694 RepID=A0A0A0EK08_9RHOB|nr:hypothetical protein [Pseudooceanicola atlanticus]KGM50640.1 hypothetical protein ATO9_03945 [Pseudooceanicola atlanticus]